MPTLTTLAAASLQRFGFITSAGLGGITDQYFPYTTLLLHGDGTNGAQNNTFLDSSTNNFTITRNGNTTQGTFSPFSQDDGKWGAYFDGSGDYLSLPQNTAQISNSDFSVEAWVYPTTTANIDLLFGNTDDATIAGSSYGLYAQRAGGNSFMFYGGSNVQLAAPAPQLNAWNHIVHARTSGTWSCFLNGARVSTVSANVTVNNGASTYPPSINRAATSSTGGGSCYMAGYRFVLGSSAYDATQTTITIPSTLPTNITNTKYLLNFTNAGILDNTGRNDLETVGNAQISTSVKKFGTGSLAFDGTGDYLVTNAPSSDLFAFGTGNFTVEMWIYFNSLATSVILDWRDASTIAAFPLLVTDSNTILWSHTNNTRITSGTVSTGQWYHLAICRSGTDTKMFLNGTQTGSTYSDSTAYLSTAGAPRVGIDRRANAYYLNGYIDDLRITKGVARYTSNFTPPTEEFPNL